MFKIDTKKVSVSYINNENIYFVNNDFISTKINDDEIVFNFQCKKDTESVCLKLLEKYIFINDVYVMNGEMKYLGYKTNGLSFGKDLLVFQDKSPEFKIDLSDSENKELYIGFKVSSYIDNKENLEIILENLTDDKYENKRLKKRVASLEKRSEIAEEKYDEILHSFYWRILAIPRKFTTRIVIWTRQHPKIAKKASFIKKVLRKGPSLIKKYGFKKIISLAKNRFKHIKISFSISKKQRDLEESYVFDRDTKISVLVPLYNTPLKYLKQMIDSVQNQTYKNWELCLADGSTKDFSFVGRVCMEYSKKDPRIKYKKLENNLGISDNTNECIAMSTGDYIALFDHDDLLHPSALFEVMKAICEKNADFIYTDEVTFVGDNTKDISVYALKPDFSPDTLRSYNYICHLSVFSRELLFKSGGGFNNNYDGSQDYDLILRLTENAENIVHVSKVLYFWRSHKASTASSISAKPYIIDSAHKALDAHLKRVGLKGKVMDGAAPSVYKIEYDIIGEPLISIIIPNKDHIDDLDKCLTSIYSESSYRNFEIIIVENNSTESETFEYYERLKRYKNLKVLYWKGKFNYSAINNFGVKEAKGEYLLLLNNDVEVINSDWLEQMLMFAQREDIGAVGAKLYYPDDTVQHAGVILGIGGIAGHAHKGIDRYDYGKMTRARIVQNLTACTAACLMIPTDVYLEVEGLDEGYAVAFNDVDLCMKIRALEKLIVFTPYAELYHYESKSRGLENTPEKVARFNSEIKRFESRWQKELDAGDPYYNPNLTLEFEDFSLK